MVDNLDVGGFSGILADSISNCENEDVSW